MPVYNIGDIERQNTAAFIFARTVRELARHGELSKEQADNIIRSYVPLFGPKGWLNGLLDRFFAKDTAENQYHFSIARHEPREVDVPATVTVDDETGVE